MKTLIDVAVPAITFILLAAVGLDLTREDFSRVRRRATVVLAGLLGRVEFARFATTYFLTELPLMLVAIAAFRSRVSG